MYYCTIIACVVLKVTHTTKELFQSANTQHRRLHIMQLQYYYTYLGFPYSLGAGDMDHREFSQACDLRTGGLTVSPQILPDHSCSLSYQQVSQSGQLYL